VPSPVGVWGLAPQKKNQFCAKNYAILSQFWYFFPILQHKNFQHAKIVTSASEKVGGGIIPLVLKVGDLSPCPPAPTPMGVAHLRGWGGATAPRNCHMKFLEVVCTALLEAVLASESQYKSEWDPFPFWVVVDAWRRPLYLRWLALGNPIPKKASHQTLFLRYQGVNRLTRVYILTL